MAEEKKFLDQAGVQYLWSKLPLQDYPSYQDLVAVINAIDETKANKNQFPFTFGIDKNGRYGYIKEGADTVTPFKTLQKVGSINIARAYNSINLSAYPGLTDSDIYLIPTNIQIAQTKTTTASETARFERTFSDGVLTIRREAFDGNITVTLPCDVYIYY